MKREQLSERIGNIDDKLVEQAENAPNFGRVHRIRNVRRMTAIAAVLALMVGSFAAGAIALAKEPETIYIEKEPEIIYVEKEQEIIIYGDSGISLILPESWKGKYGYTMLDESSMEVYHLATRESFEYGGVFFWIDFLEERYPLDHVYPSPGFTIAITETGTYMVAYPSDVQVDIDNEAARAEYYEMYEEVGNVEIVMSADMLAGTMNASNWVQGTLMVTFLDDDRTYVCDAEQSHIIKEIVQSQEHTGEGAILRPAYDVIIMFDGYEYWLSFEYGEMFDNSDGMTLFLVSAEDLATLQAVIDGLGAGD